MIDVGLLRNNYEDTKNLILKKDPSFPVDDLVTLDIQFRTLKNDVEILRKEKNDFASQAKTGINDVIRYQSIEIGKSLKDAENNLAICEQKFNNLLLSCPNIPFSDLPNGGKESNQVVRVYGEKIQHNFLVKNHVVLGENNNWFDLIRSVKIASSGFIFYKEMGVRVLYALAQFFIKNNRKHGFELQLPPYLVNEESMTVAGNFPKFKEEVFALPADNLYLIPTAEVSLTNLYRDEILLKDELPKRMTAWTGCFRREAGGYGKHERGLIRIHEFEKVELVSLCEPQYSSIELDKMIACAEDILQQLGLHYRVSLLAAQDCSFQSAKTYDIEVWLPGQQAYYEVSSASNCTDFQSRRGKIRYRDGFGAKTQLVHTLNASSLALPRVMVAIMETYQNSNGEIELPAIIRDNLW